MNITELKDSIRLCRESGVTPWVWGHRGIGKSTAIVQLTNEMAIGFKDFRCSQIEASDLRGLPDRSDGRTVYFPPDDLPREFSKEEIVHLLETKGKLKGKSEDEKKKIFDATNLKLNSGILFLDELNRAEDDVIQAVFQLVLDRCIGSYKLPEGWSVVVAGNYPEGYNVNNFSDPAFLDRFVHLEVDARNKDYVSDWTDYMSSRHKNTKILQFIGANIDHLVGNVEGQLDFTIQPSPRSWDSIARVDKAASRYEANIVFFVLKGLIGMSLAQQYQRFSCKVLPREVIERGVKAVEKKKLTRNEVTGLMWGIAAESRDIKTLSDKEADNILEFMSWLAKSQERDLAVTFGSQLVKGECSLGAAMLSNPHLVKLMSKSVTKNKRSWINKIDAKPSLQKLMSQTAWGKSDDE